MAIENGSGPTDSHNRKRESRVFTLNLEVNVKKNVLRDILKTNSKQTKKKSVMKRTLNTSLKHSSAGTQDS